MPRGTERILTYVRERDAQGRVVIRALPSAPCGEERKGQSAPAGEPVGSN